MKSGTLYVIRRTTNSATLSPEPYVRNFLKFFQLKYSRRVFHKVLYPDPLYAPLIQITINKWSSGYVYLSKVGDFWSNRELISLLYSSGMDHIRIFTLGLDADILVWLQKIIIRASNHPTGIAKFWSWVRTPNRYLLSLKMVICTESETSASSPVCSLYT